MRKVAVLFGGKSPEHEISLISGMNIVSALDRTKFLPVLIGIDKNGGWFLQDEKKILSKTPDPKTIALDDFSRPLALMPGRGESAVFDIVENKPLEGICCVFPILHGPYGEDGTMQGLIKQLNLPFVGPGVLGSSVGMDKEIMKRVLHSAGIPNAEFVTLFAEDRSSITFAPVFEKLGLPMFVKPANLGSSVGISKVKSEEDFYKALDLAFTYDRKIIVEEFVKGRELECAVLGNENPEASVPGEVIPVAEFYSYEAKYLDDKGAILELPAKNLDENSLARIKALAVQTFRILGCEGLTRVDFFMKENGDLFINEINTMPGFTRISMYPKLWELSGVPYPELLSRLIELAISRFQRESRLDSNMHFG
jgi:D-alanine-D-alanine ligase